jgi:hypothetical protein
MFEFEYVPVTDVKINLRSKLRKFSLTRWETLQAKSYGEVATKNGSVTLRNVKSGINNFEYTW